MDLQLGGFRWGKGAIPPKTPEVALRHMHYILTVASYVSLNPLPIQY